ncbi:hypothetical protein U9M48_016162 [Paspalum notatum var. saurae]|uniref:Uncharacterized protein n=1 Tax=Paspalum notatum var. saurae TaxID=547442 RepID=A0AAQ3T4W7_PASNO
MDMARGLLHSAGAATAAAWWPCSLVPAPRRSLPSELPSHTGQGALLAARIQSVSPTEVAMVSRPEDLSTAQGDLSMTPCVDSVPGVVVVISGYWTGPDVDDGCGSVEAMLQRIA